MAVFLRRKFAFVFFSVNQHLSIYYVGDSMLNPGNTIIKVSALEVLIGKKLSISEVASGSKLGKQQTGGPRRERAVRGRMPGTR